MRNHTGYLVTKLNQLSCCDLYLHDVYVYTCLLFNCPNALPHPVSIQSSKEALSDVNATGVAMLFSAGTFLYVATVHVLPEVGGMGGHSHSAGGGKGLSKVEVLALVIGCLIPLVLSVGHHH